DEHTHHHHDDGGQQLRAGVGKESTHRLKGLLEDRDDLFHSFLHRDTCPASRFPAIARPERVKLAHFRGDLSVLRVSSRCRRGTLKCETKFLETPSPGSTDENHGISARPATTQFPSVRKSLRACSPEERFALLESSLIDGGAPDRGRVHERRVVEIEEVVH